MDSNPPLHFTSVSRFLYIFSEALQVRSLYNTVVLQGPLQSCYAVQEPGN